MPSLLLIFSEDVPSPDLDITEGGEAQNAAKDYLVEQRTRSVVQRRTVRKAPKGVCSEQVFSEHISMSLI